jgi:hypothetical protein
MTSDDLHKELSFASGWWMRVAILPVLQELGDLSLNPDFKILNHSHTEILCLLKNKNQWVKDNALESQTYSETFLSFLGGGESTPGFELGPPT